MALNDDKKKKQGLVDSLLRPAATSPAAREARLAAKSPEEQAKITARWQPPAPPGSAPPVVAAPAPAPRPSTHVQDVRNSTGIQALRGVRDGVVGMVTGAREKRAAMIQNQNAARPSFNNVQAETTTRQAPAAPKVPPAPAVAAPNFANVTGGANTSYGRPADPASRPGAQEGAGAPSSAGAGSASYYIGGDGRRRTVNSDGTIAGTTANATTVNRQNFGTPVVPQAQASIARPASTFGQSVLNMPDDNAVPVQRPVSGFRGPGAMAEQYNSREDREARQKASGDIDTMLFQLRGKNDRASLAAMGELMGQKARLAGGAEQLSAEAMQNRDQRANVLDNTGLEQAGANQRQQMQGDVTREGNFLDYDAKNRETDASLIEKPSFVTDANGRYLRVGTDGAAPVTDAAGNPIQMPQAAQQTRDYQGEAFNDLVADLMEGQRDTAGNLPPNAVQTAIAQAQQVQAARQPQAAPQAAPQAGTVKNGYRFKGGNPADQKNWEKVQ